MSFINFAILQKSWKSRVLTPLILYSLNKGIILLFIYLNLEIVKATVLLEFFETVSQFKVFIKLFINNLSLECRAIVIRNNILLLTEKEPSPIKTPAIQL